MQAEDIIRRGERHAEAGEADEAIRCFQEALELGPQQPGAVLEILASELVRARRFDEADETYGRLERQQPQKPAGIVGRARVAQARNDWDSALALWEESLLRFSAVARPIWNKHRADALLHLGRNDEASAAFRALDVDHPGKPWGRVGLAMTAARTGNWQEALSLWEQCFERFPDSIRPWWHTQMQRVLVASGDLQRAHDEMKKTHTSATAQAYFSIVEDTRRSVPGDQRAVLNFESVLLVSYGRSGSTLLQGILNSIDGVLVRGENQNAFEHLYRMAANLQQSKREHLGAILPNQPWYGIGAVDEDDLMSRLRDLARSILLGDRIDDDTVRAYGFKEVRYDKVGDRLDGYLDFLRRIFPKPAIVFNTRNLDDVARSAWWKDEDAHRVRQKLCAVERRFRGYAATRPDCFEIAYEDVVSKGKKLEDLFEFLGAPFLRDRIDTILAIPHSYDPSQKNVQKLLKDF